MILHLEGQGKTEGSQLTHLRTTQAEILEGMAAYDAQVTQELDAAATAGMEPNVHLDIREEQELAEAIRISIETGVQHLDPPLGGGVLSCEEEQGEPRQTTSGSPFRSRRSSSCG
jgi:hypothetical protein